MKKVVLVLLLSGAVQVFGQTKKIAHRSHSGSDASFDMDSEDNFGLYPAYKKQEKDSTVKKHAIAGKDSTPAKKTIPPKYVKTKFVAIRKTKVKG